jgi:hypothetical protein
MQPYYVTRQEQQEIASALRDRARTAARAVTIMRERTSGSEGAIARAEWQASAAERLAELFGKAEVVDLYLPE